MKNAIEIMRVTEKYPDIKTVIIDVTTDNPYIPKVVHIETKTGAGINWKTEAPYGDFQEYSKTKFDNITWFIGSRY